MSRSSSGRERRRDAVGSRLERAGLAEGAAEEPEGDTAPEGAPRRRGFAPRVFRLAPLFTVKSNGTRGGSSGRRQNHAAQPAPPGAAPRTATSGDPTRRAHRRPRPGAAGGVATGPGAQRQSSSATTGQMPMTLLVRNTSPACRSSPKSASRISHAMPSARARSRTRSRCAPFTPQRDSSGVTSVAPRVKKTLLMVPSTRRPSASSEQAFANRGIAPFRRGRARSRDG